jgi:hypothetical protein
MPGPVERERLLRAVVDVYAEAGDLEPAGAGAASEEAAANGPAAALGTEDEELLAAVRAVLEEIAAAVSGRPAPPRGAIVAALEGAELTLRMELSAGVRGGLPRLLPGFAYMVTLPSLGEPRAARLAVRVRALGEEYEREGGR